MRDDDRRLFRARYRRGFDGKWIPCADAEILHLGDTFVTVKAGVWVVSARDSGVGIEVRAMKGMVVKRGIATLFRNVIPFRHLRGEEAQEVLEDYDAKVGGLLDGMERGDG